MNKTTDGYRFGILPIPAYLCEIRLDTVMLKDILPIIALVLIFLGVYYLLSIDDPYKIHQIIIASVPAILVYYLVVKRSNGKVNGRSAKNANVPK